LQKMMKIIGSSMLILLGIFSDVLLLSGNLKAQDSSFSVSGIPCDFNIPHATIEMPRNANLRIKVLQSSTASFNDFYAVVGPWPVPRYYYLFQNRIPEVGEIWDFGPLRLADKVDFFIFSRILDERYDFEPTRHGKLVEVEDEHWQISFEDWCDFDWDDLVVDIILTEPRPTIYISKPADLMSFVSDDHIKYEVKAEAWAFDINGRDISNQIDWLVLPGNYSGYCTPSYRFNSPEFHFTAYIAPRVERGSWPLNYDLFASVNPDVIRIYDVNRLVQDVIDVVRQQYVDYQIKLPYKSQFVEDPAGAIIPSIYREPLYQIFNETKQAYRNWAGDPNAYFVVSSGYRTPDHNRHVGGVQHSMHQYHWAIDMDFGDEGQPGTRDDQDFLFRFLRRYFDNQYEMDDHVIMHDGYTHLERYDYGDNFPGIER